MKQNHLFVVISYPLQFDSHVSKNILNPFSSIFKIVIFNIWYKTKNVYNNIFFKFFYFLESLKKHSILHQNVYNSQYFMRVPLLNHF